MPSFSRSSKARLRTARPSLISIFEEVVLWFDCTVLEGHRGKEAQNAAADAGNSQIRWPRGKHNSYPSKAVDVGPYDPRARGVEWDIKVVEPRHRGLVRWKAVWNLCRFYYFAGFVVGMARARGIKLRWGGDWDGDTFLDDQSFRDLVHFEEVDE